MSRLVAVLVRGEFHWGFSIRFPLATMSESFPVPPPTTLVGALARGLAEVGILSNTEMYALQVSSRKKREVALYSTAVRVVNAVKVVTFRYTRPSDKEHSFHSMPVPYADPLRLLRTPYMREKYRSEKHKQEWFGFAKSGRVYAPSLNFEVLYIIDTNEFLRTCNKALSEKDLVKACYAMPCIGSKESIVAIHEVLYSENVRMTVYSNNTKERLKTQFYIPADAVCLNTIEGDHVIVDLPYPIRDWYMIGSKDTILTVNSALRKFVVPIRQGLFIEQTTISFVPQKGAKLYEATIGNITIKIVWK